MMKQLYSLPPDTDKLRAIADSLAWTLEDKYAELGIGCEVEALLRASMAAYEFGLDRYLTLLAAGDGSPEALMFLAEARVRCHRSIQKLRRRVAQSIAHLCRILDDDALTTVVRQLIAVCA